MTHIQRSRPPAILRFVLFSKAGEVKENFVGTAPYTERRRRAQNRKQYEAQVHMPYRFPFQSIQVVAPPPVMPSPGMICDPSSDPVIIDEFMDFDINDDDPFPIFINEQD